MNTSYTACIKACAACLVACQNCAASCLKEEDVQMMAKCIALDLDCADICQLALAYMSRDSEFAPQLCQLCAQICRSCAEECGKHQPAHCQECAKACTTCAEACEKMAA